MLELAAFADEISPRLSEQIEHCVAHGIRGIELRGVEGVNVLDLDAGRCREIKARVADHGLRIVSIGSPIGKVSIDESFDRHFDRFKRAVELAEYFDAPMIRVFSYFAADDGSLDRSEVIERFRKKVAYMEKRKAILVHENEKDIYGDTAGRCLDLLQTIASPKLRAAFDFANFVQVGDDPSAGWPLLESFVGHFHIKDAIMGSGAVVPVGEGDGRVGDILADAYAKGYRGLLSLEPHLAAAGPFSGFSGPALFKVAVDALKNLAVARSIPLAV